MKLATQHIDRNRALWPRAARAGAPDRAVRIKGRLSAFTLAEMLAALLFLAIVIPTAVEALRVASLAGEVAARKSEAARVADRVLNESVVTTNWAGGVLSGLVTEGILDFRWKLTATGWPQDAMQLLTAEVTYSAQGRDFTVRLSTLANLQTMAQPGGTGTGTAPATAQ